MKLIGREKENEDRNVALQKAGISKNIGAGGLHIILLLHLFCLNNYVFVAAFVMCDVTETKGFLPVF